MATLNHADIQGYILRGYRMPTVRHYILTINDAKAGKQFIGDLVNGQKNSDIPQITTGISDPWLEKKKPPYCLNIGFTYHGLAALGLPLSSLDSFSPAFVEGAAARAGLLGDTDESAPQNWEGRLGTYKAHVLLSLYVKGEEPEDREQELNEKSQVLEELFQKSYVSRLYMRDGNALDDGKEHFGFKDGISQPFIKGAPPPRPEDKYDKERDHIPAGAFLLGYPSQWKDFSYPLPQPHILCLNGSFAAFRILEQDVKGFQEYLQGQEEGFSIPREGLAAKIVGRKKDGTPLAPSSGENQFDFRDDQHGYGCPFGSHIRRMNPRSDEIAGDEPGEASVRRRIIRRGMPYGPPYKDDPRGKRGLLGLFICASLEDQFEFLMRQWANRGGFHGATPSWSKDPLIGNNTTDESAFIIPQESGPLEVKGFSRFVTTRGGLYCFLPSITALRYLASL